jgi:hypothetical protein
LKLVKDETFRKIEHYLYNYHKYLQDIAEQRNDIIYESSYRLDGLPKPKTTSDSTGRKGSNTAGLYESEQGQWVTLIHDAFYLMDKRYKFYIKYKYFDKLNPNKIIKKLYSSNTQIYEYRKNTITFIALLATQRGLEKPINETMKTKKARL